MTSQSHDLVIKTILWDKNLKAQTIIYKTCGGNKLCLLYFSHSGASKSAEKPIKWVINSRYIYTYIYISPKPKNLVVREGEKRQIFIHLL